MSQSRRPTHEPTRLGTSTFDTFNAFRAQQRSFSTLSMYFGAAFRIEARSTAVDVVVEGVMPAYFDLVGARLAAGRFLTESEIDLAAGATPVAVISERLWKRMFGGDVRAVGETMKVDGRPVTIVGVTAPGFEGLQLDGGVDLFLPISLFRTLLGDPNGPVRAPYVIGLLAPDVTLEQARAEVLGRWPGIQAATVASLPPAAQTSVKSQRIVVESGLTEFISPGFFDMFGIAHLRGRDFTWQDDGQAPPVTIVSETLAGKLFPDGNVIGRRMRLTSGSASTDLEIVGVVADAPIGRIREPHLAVAFRPMMQDLTRAQFPLAHVRVNGDLKSVRDAYVRVVESQGHHFVRVVFTLDEWIDYALLQERLIAGVSTSAAVLAVLLACLGIYGLLAYAVTSRVREIGVRMALGAARATVLQMIVRDGLTVVVPGVLIGIPCALGAARLVRSQLYGVMPTDPPTIIGAAVLFIVTGVVAALAPAVRASKIDPIDALRQE